MSYNLGDKIGEGSFGKVYQLCQNNIKTDKVVKYIDISCGGIQNYIEPFILLNLDHQNLMSAFEIILNKENLLKIVQTKAIGDLGSLCLKKIKKEKYIIFNNIINGLLYLHKKNILHGDIKPENILAFPKNYKLNDFSFSFLMSKKEEKLKTYIYSPNYRPPEIKKLKVYLNSDVWALGKTFYNLFGKTRSILDMMNSDPDKRLCLKTLVDLREEKNDFLTDREIIEKNSKLKFKNQRHQKIFCKKLKNKGGNIGCTKNYLEFEKNLVNLFFFKIEI